MESRIDQEQSLLGGSTFQAEPVSEGAPVELKLYEMTALETGPTGISENWQPWLASGYLDVGYGASRRSINLNGVTTRGSNGQWSDFLGAGLNGNEGGGTLYMVVQPQGPWLLGRFGLAGSGTYIDRPESSGAMRLSVDDRTLNLVVGRGEAPEQKNNAAATADLNGDGDTKDFVYAKASFNTKWYPNTWYFIGASWAEGKEPVLYVRRLGFEGPESSPKAWNGKVEKAKGNVVEKVPPGSTGPSSEPIVIGSWMQRTPQNKVLDAADARIAWFRLDSGYADADQMAAVFDSLGSGKPIVPAPPKLRDAKITISHHEPCNIFEEGTPVSYTLNLGGFYNESVKVSIKVVDYWGNTVAESDGSASPNEAAQVNFGTLSPGYYNMTVQAVEDVDGQPHEAMVERSFGVAPFSDMSAQEFLDEGRRFGLKKFNLGKAWWRNNEAWRAEEAIQAMSKLGLQWTRDAVNVSGEDQLDTVDMLKNYPILCVLKVERFPESCYDVERYGPLDDFAKKHGGYWGRNSVPMKEPYQKWLAEELRKLPPGEYIFEVGNETAGKMSPEEYAEWCNMVVEVVDEVMPGSQVGINPTGKPDWETAFAKAGGFKGIDMVALHPYSFTPQPERRTRMALRAYRDFLTGLGVGDLDIHITEYGWPTAPRDRRFNSVSENVQAQRTVRQSLMLYAEGAKTLIPHWMADREYDPNDRENWFGFFRLNHEPKPVIMAHAACARLIDGSEFVGDLWYGRGIGAMLFQRDGVYTLALWTIDGEPDEFRDLTLDTDAKSLVQYNIMGDGQERATRDGKLTVALSGDMTYLVGVGPQLAEQATPPDEELNADRWVDRSGEVSIPYTAQAMKIDGYLDDWANLPPVDWVALGEDYTGSDEVQFAGVAWDEDTLYIAAAATLTDEKRPDRLNVSICTYPGRQPSLGMRVIHDYQIQLTAPTDKEPASLSIENLLYEPQKLTPEPGETSGICWAAVKTETGWRAEIAIPKSMLFLFQPQADARISAAIRITGYPPGNPGVGKFEAGHLGEDQTWPYLRLRL